MRKAGESWSPGKAPNGLDHIVSKQATFYKPGISFESGDGVSDTIRILGLDPGLRNTGWGMIASTGTQLSYIASGCRSPPRGQR